MALSRETAVNPYAAPKARVEETPAAGAAWREGKRVRIKIEGALPDRCVVCNAAAAGARISRTLYWSPLRWRLGAFFAPFVVWGIGGLLDLELFIYAFWPLALTLFVVNFFVRKSLRVELGICPAHQRIRLVLQVLSIGAMAAVAFGLFTWQQSMALLWPALAAVVALAMIQPFIGVNAVRLKAIADEDAWLTGTGKAFFEGLPEAPG